MISLVRGIKPDLIHLHAPNGWTALTVLLAGGRRPLIISHHADILGREPARSLVMAGYRHLARRARAIVVSMSNNFTYSADLKGIPTPPTVIPYCVEPSPFAGEPGFADEALALRRGRFGDSPVAIFLGRLVPYKGADRMVEALVSTPDLNIVVVGSGPLREALEAQARNLGVADRLLVTGACDERTKNLWLAASDFMILPSVTIAEAFGIVQVEAMLWSKPVLTTDLPSGVPQVGEHGVTSLVVPPGDVAALAAAMRLLSTDAPLRERLGRAGLQRARTLYSVDRFRQTLLDLYARAAA
jgi:rhamnosyl/mannosyltransferase